MIYALGLLAFTQGATIGYLFRTRKVRKSNMTHLFSGEVKSVTYSMTQDGSMGTLEFVDHTGVNMPRMDTYRPTVETSGTPDSTHARPSFSAPTTFQSGRRSGRNASMEMRRRTIYNIDEGVQ